MNKPIFTTIRKPLFAIPFTISFLVGSASDYARFETYLKEEIRRPLKIVEQSKKEERVFYFKPAERASIAQDSERKESLIYAEATDLDSSTMVRIHFPGTLI